MSKHAAGTSIQQTAHRQTEGGPCMQGRVRQGKNPSYGQMREEKKSAGLGRSPYPLKTLQDRELSAILVRL